MCIYEVGKEQQKQLRKSSFPSFTIPLIFYKLLFSSLNIYKNVLIYVQPVRKEHLQKVSYPLPIQFQMYLKSTPY